MLNFGASKPRVNWGPLDPHLHAEQKSVKLHKKCVYGSHTIAMGATYQDIGMVSSLSFTHNTQSLLKGTWIHYPGGKEMIGSVSLNYDPIWLKV